MELKKIWMSPDTGRGSRFARRTVGGVLGIALLMLLLIGGGVVSGALVGLKKYGVASAIAAFAPFAAICFFAHKCYWYVTDVFVAIDEKGFDPNFLWFAGLALGAFIIGEIAVYTRKEKAA